MDNSCWNCGGNRNNHDSEAADRCAREWRRKSEAHDATNDKTRAEKAEARVKELEARLRLQEDP